MLRYYDIFNILNKISELSYTNSKLAGLHRFLYVKLFFIYYFIKFNFTVIRYNVIRYTKLFKYCFHKNL